MVVDYGIVYVLTNSAMPGLVKIGMTNRLNITARLKELSSATGVPVPFELAYACKVPINQTMKVERALHVAFAPYRLNPSREFFQIQPAQAIAILEVLDRNDDSESVTQELSQEINRDISNEDRAAIAKIEKARKKRPTFKFREMGIPIGAKLFFIDDRTKVVEVIDDRRVVFEGKQCSLTAATKELMGISYAPSLSQWEYNGREFGDIYDETYPVED